MDCTECKYELSTSINIEEYWSEDKCEGDPGFIRNINK